MRPAAVFAWFAGLGFGVPGLYGLWFLIDHDRVWPFLGFPTYGGGPFGDVGLDSSPGLLAAFVGVCGLEMLAGFWLWARQRRGVRRHGAGVLRQLDRARLVVLATAGPQVRVQRRLGIDDHAATVGEAHHDVGTARAIHDALDLTELPADLLNDEERLSLIHI